MILTDFQIQQYSEDIDNPMIKPFVNHPVRKRGVNKVISYGLGHYGYDMRLGEHFMIPVRDKVIDPKAPKEENWVRLDYSSFFLLYPGEFILGESVETWNIPNDVLGLVIGKSTYARSGLIVNCTPMEPGWKGVLTIELHNAGHAPIRVYPGEGIAQVLFFKGDYPPTMSYGTKAGKYQNQQGVTLGKA